MKKTYLFLISVVLTISIKAQLAPPQGINYQAMVYVPYSKQQAGANIAGQVPANTEQVLVKFTLEEGNNGQIIYEEIQNKQTDRYGLLNTIIGAGTKTPISPGDFKSINWGKGDPYLRVSITLTDYNTTINSYQKLWSVPYSLYSDYANKAGNGISGITENGNGSITINKLDGSSITTGPILNNWKLTGNTGTNSTNFIGTTDNQDLIIKSNNIERLRIKSNGNIGIGIETPTEKLELNNGGLRINGNYGIGFNDNPYPNTIPNGFEGAKIYFDNTLVSNGNKEYLFIEKKDGNTIIPDGGIVFANRGNDGIRKPSMLITGAGDIGIGTITPTEKLELNNGGIRINGNYGIGFNDNPYPNTIPNGFEGAKIYFDNTLFSDGNKEYLFIEKKDGNTIIPDGGIAFTNRGTDGIRKPSMLINGSGHVGVGTILPVRTLHIKDVMRMEPRSTAPSSPGEGDIYYDSTLKKLRVFDGTTWQSCW
jgi:hypothetical protein